MDKIELLQRLVRINSENPPGNEKEIAFFIKDFLEDLKIKTELIEFDENRFNLIASIGKGNGLMLNGHMDTVPVGKVEEWRFNPFGEIVNGRVYGRGTVDMKGGLASILTAVKNLVKSGFTFKRKLLLVFVGDEEVALRGSKFLMDKRKDLFSNIKYGVIAEPTKMTITRAQKGIVDMKIKFKGKAAHGSRPEQGDNAIYKACNVIQEIRKLIERLKKKKNPTLGSGTINVGTICGGTKVNIVPDYCEIEIDRRIIPGETPKLARKQIQNILKKLKIRAKVEIVVSRLPLEIPEDSELITLLKKITGKGTRGESGYTESELYYRECGIECVTCGPGNMNLSHKANECIKIKELKKAVYVYENLIKKLCC
jgi:acetylornithine deacetylase/succinyl-diaminopimelate desuccinylase family protein